MSDFGTLPPVSAFTTRMATFRMGSGSEFVSGADEINELELLLRWSWPGRRARVAFRLRRLLLPYVVEQRHSFPNQPRSRA
jgi:hypothetical protein